MSFLSGKKLFILGFIVVLLVGIPLTLYIIQKQQQTQSHAQKSTTLLFSPESTQSQPLQKNIGDTIPLDITVNPGTNLVSFLKLDIEYDPAKLATASANAFVLNTASNMSILEGPIYSPGKILMTLSIGSDPTKALQATTSVATINFTALAATGGTPTLVTYADQSQVSSVGSNDQFAENVLSTTNPAAIVIGGGTSTTPTATPSATLSPTTTPVPTATTAPTPTTVATGGGKPTTNLPPVCSTLTADRDTTSGTAPFSVAFTASGNDANGTVSKVTFNFGDGPVTNLTETGGIGTNSVSVQSSHTYTNAGTYQASAILTDNQGAVSDATTCRVTVTVTGASTGGTGGGGVTPTGTTIATATPTLGATGPGDTILGFGAVVGVLSILGAVLFFAL